MSLSADLSCLQSGAGAEREAALASLEKQLICPICLEIFNKPVVILPCQHNLCRKCANDLYQPSLFQARTSMLVSSGRFRCPSCRHEVVLDRHGVYGLQRNLLVENIIDVYKQEVCKSISISSPPHPPSPLPPPELAQATCVDHEGEKVNIYCLSCRVPTCSLCKVFGAHQSCRVAPLADVYQQQKDELKEGLSALAEHGTKIQEMIDELNQMCSDLEEAYKVQKQTVSDKFDHIKSILEERRKSLTEVMSAEEEQKTGRAKALLRCYGDTLTTNTKLLERAQSTVEDPDSVAFVQSSRELIEKLVAANASCPTETLDPDDENLSHYKYNFSPQYRALLSLQFPRVEEDVPEEPESEPETEDPDDTQDVEDTQDLEDTQDVEDTAPVQYIESPSQTVKDSPLIVPPEPVQVQDRDGDNEERPRLQQDTADRGDSEGTELRYRGAGQAQVQREKSVPVSPEAVKEEGMTTLQANEAGSEECEAMPLPVNGKDGEALTDEETGTLLYPGWYRQSNCGRVSAANEDTRENSNDTAEDIDSQQTVSKPNGENVQLAAEAVCPLLDCQNVLDQNLSDSTPKSSHLDKALTIKPRVEESRDVASLPSATSAKPEDENSQEGKAQANAINLANIASLPCATSVKPEDENGQDGNAQTNAINLANIASLPCATSAKPEDENGQDGNAQTNATNIAKEQRQSGVENVSFDVTAEDVAEGNPKDDISSCGDVGEELSGTVLVIGTGGDGEEFAEESVTEDATGDAEDAVGNQEEALESTATERAGDVAVQAVTLLFYLLAFLVILQRFWVYIGRYILI